MPGLLFVLLAVVPSRADELLARVKFTDTHDVNRTVEGKIVVTAEDGGILLLGRDGRLWNVTPARMERKEEIEGSFTPLAADELAAELLRELNTPSNQNPDATVRCHR